MTDMNVPEDGGASLDGMLNTALKEKDPAVRLIDLKNISAMARAVEAKYREPEERSYTRRKWGTALGVLATVGILALTAPMSIPVMIVGGVFFGEVAVYATDALLQSGLTKSEQARYLAEKAEDAFRNTINDLDLAAFTESPHAKTALRDVPGLADAFRAAQAKMRIYVVTAEKAAELAGEKPEAANNDKAADVPDIPVAKKGAKPFNV